MNDPIEITNDDGDRITISVYPSTVPTTASPFHPSATHVDALGMPVAISVHDYVDGDGRQVVDEWPYHPTPCCGAAASISDPDYGMYCKGCYEQVDGAFGNVPLLPFRPVGEVA